MTLPERIAELTRELPPEKQVEVLDFVEYLRAKRASLGIARRGSLEALHTVLRAAADAGDDEPDWSPLDIEPAELRDVVWIHEGPARHERARDPVPQGSGAA